MLSSQLVRGAAQLLSALGVQKVVSDVIKNNTVVVSTTDKVLVTAGSLVMGSMIGQQAHKHVVEVLDSIKVTFDPNKDDSNE